MIASRTRRKNIAFLINLVRGLSFAALWSRGQDTRFSSLERGFNSRQGHFSLGEGVRWTKCHQNSLNVRQVRTNIAGQSSLEARRPHKPKVGGSNPPPAINGGIAQLGEHLPCKQGVKGSNPFISIQDPQMPTHMKNFFVHDFHFSLGFIQIFQQYWFIWLRGKASYIF